MENEKLLVSKTRVEFLRKVAAKYKQSNSDIRQSMAEGIELALEILRLDEETKN